MPLGQWRGAALIHVLVLLSLSLPCPSQPVVEVDRSKPGGGKCGNGEREGGDPDVLSAIMARSSCWQEAASDGIIWCRVQAEARVSGAVSAREYFGSVFMSWASRVLATAGGVELWKGSLGDIDGNATLVRSDEGDRFVRWIRATGRVPFTTNEVSIEISVSSGNASSLAPRSAQAGLQHALAHARGTCSCGAGADEAPIASDAGPPGKGLTRGFEAWGRSFFGPPSTLWPRLGSFQGAGGLTEDEAAAFLPITGNGGSQWRADAIDQGWEGGDREIRSQSAGIAGVC